MENTEKKQKEPMSPKKKVKIIIASMVALFVVCVVLISILDKAPDGKSERETLPAVDPLLLHETYDEKFDIMEYEEYLSLNRTVFIKDKRTGVTQSVSENDAESYGEGFLTVYRVIEAIINGDSELYNSYMGDSWFYKDEFTQQQLYDIVIVPESSDEEYIFTVTYRIHENNGTYRDTIESDVSRPQIFIVDMDTLKVTDIIEQGYKK